MTEARDVADLFLERGDSLAVAESATGGLLSSKLVDVPGASDWFDRGYVTYSYAAKEQELGVDRDVLESEGAVSAEVVEQMAEGALRAADVDWSAATSGIAGPTGGSEEKPVGTVYVGVAYIEADEVHVDSRRFEFEGSRVELKEKFADATLQMLESRLTR